MKSQLLIGALTAAWICSAVAQPTVSDPTFTVTTYASVPDFSTGMVFIGPDDILVNQKNNGQVLRVTNGASAGIVLDLPVNSNSERGLLGITLHPDFPAQPYVYFYYTRAQTAAPGGVQDGGTALANRVSRFTWNGAALAAEHVLIDLPCTPGPNHNGGIIKFGPPTAPPADQKLYIVIGDLNRDNQTENYAAGNPPDFTGQILRLNADGSIPDGADRGPFYDVAGGNENLKSLFAYGIRNSYGMDFDPVTGWLWDTENGPNTYDEINLVDAGFNSGWETVMGPSGGSFPNPLVQFSGIGTYSEPEFSWYKTIAPTALHFFRGTGLGAAYQFNCFVGGSNNGVIYRFPMNSARTGFDLTGNLADLVLDTADSATPITFGRNFVSVIDLVTGRDGNLYVLDYFGTIYQVKGAGSTAVEEWQLYE